MPFPGDTSDETRRDGDSPWGAGRGPSPRARLIFPVLVCLAVQIPSVFITWHGRGLATANTPGLLLALELVLNIVGPLALLAARRYPGPVVAAVAALAVADLFIDGPVGGPPFLALGFAIVSAVVRGARVWAWVSVAVAWTVSLVLAGLVDASWPALRVTTTTLGLLIVLGIAESVRGRRDRVAAQRRLVGEKRLSDVQAERVRIARELHDVLAHSLSQINVQASVGLHLAESQPDTARDALASIKESSKSALDEVRSVLGMLRAEASGQSTAPLVPEPDLGRLPALIASVRDQGLDVSLSGSVQDASPAVQLALYRIVQESLTNVVRHADARLATVELSDDGDGYTVRVSDDGRVGVWPAPEGRGLLGMRERAELLGGTLEAGPSGSERSSPGSGSGHSRGSGFTVTAYIPHRKDLP